MIKSIIIRFYKIVIVLLFIGVISCTKEINIEIPQKEYRMVVNSTISPFIPYPQPVYVKLNKSIHISDTSMNTIITDAVVQLYSEGNLVDTLHFVDSLGIYISKGILNPEPGKEYSIIAEHPDYNTVTATTTIPEQIEIIDTVVTSLVSVNDVGDPYNEVALTFKDLAGIKNYYEVILSIEWLNYFSDEYYYTLSSSDRIITREKYYPQLERFDLEKPKYLLFSDDGIDGEKHTLHFNYMPPRTFDNEGNHISSHYITIQLRNITKEYYTFKTSWLYQINNQVEDVLYGGHEPDNVFTNIENGYGLFAGFNHDGGTLFVEQVDY